MGWLQRAYGEDINSQNSKFIIDFLKSRVPLKKKVCKSLCIKALNLLCLLFTGDAVLLAIFLDEHVIWLPA